MLSSVSVSVLVDSAGVASIDVIFKSLFNSLGGLAIGNLTSQLFANFLLMGLDNLIHDYAELAGRYVDDFYMLGDKSIIYSIPKI